MLCRKVLRDMKENKGAYAACIVVIIIGLTIFTSFSAVTDNLTLAQRNFYRDQNFADGFAEVRRMPYREIEKLKQIPGIKDIQGRMVEDVRVFTPDGESDVYLRLVSVDPLKENPINGVHLTEGLPLKKGAMQIWVDSKFFEANNLKLNQEIEIIAEGRKRSLHLVGAGQSPEFIYAMRNSSDIYPDPEKFGIAYIPLDSMQKIFSNRNTVNSIIFTLQPGAAYSSVEQELEPKLKKFGLENLYPRKDQTSDLLLTSELKGIQAMSTSIPALFLSVAGAILYIMLRRMVDQQRGQIGILKALGYTNKEILFHYMTYPLTCGLVGGIIGGLGGIALSFPLTSLYGWFFNMPGLQGSFSPWYFLECILISLVFSAFAGYQGSKRSLSLHPAEAMRPPAPPSTNKTLVERAVLFWNMLTVQGRMAVRNIFRSPGRTFFIFFGIMFAFSLGGMTWAFKDMSEQMLYDQYEKIEKYSAKVFLSAPKDARHAASELGRFPGVKRAEPMAEIPLTLKNQWREKNVVLLGIPKDSTLYSIMDKDYKSVPPPEDGILISERLADLLGARPGSTLSLESPLMRDPEQEKTVRVSGVIPQHLGLNAYMELEAAQALIDNGRFATIVMLKMDEENIPALQEEYNTSSAVSEISNRTEMLNKTREMMGSFISMVFIFALFAILIGFAVIYNSSIITLSERSRELASMMVLGMTPSEVLSVITFEQWFIGGFAMLAGIPLTKLLLVAMAESISSDLYTMPTTMSLMAVCTAFIITVTSIWIAQRLAGKKIRNLSLVEVLKSRE
ncbi:MAG: ABC transporter permease [Bacillota bacterium]|jgi:putative ABC transport system permease protein